MTKTRLDIELTRRKLAPSRSQAESMIKLGKVTVEGSMVTKPGHFVGSEATIVLKAEARYVSRAGLKLASVAQLLKLDFRNSTVLDVGSSTGGFTDYALKNGARKVYAVDVGTEQLHPSLRRHPQIELHEKTDIRDVYVAGPVSWSAPDFREQVHAKSGAAPPTATRTSVMIDSIPDIVVIDVSFISLREILPHIATHLSNKSTQIVAMVKPQFEAGRQQVTKGVIKNDAMRRQILREFEAWSRQYFTIVDKRDSDVAGAKGNQERFYLLKRL